MWPFILTKTFFTSRQVAVSQKDAVDFLHDVPSFISLGPLVESYALEEGSDPCTYTIVDRLKMGFTTTYRATFTTCNDGLDVEVNAGAWTRLRTEYRVRPTRGHELGVLMIEHVTVYGLFCFMPFIYATLTKSHLEGQERLVRTLEKRHPREISMNSSSLSYYLNVVPAYAFYVVAITSFLAFIFFANKRSDPYGTFHHSLNKLPGEDPNAPPKTEWLNMGYWKNTSVFPEACQALALKLIRAADSQAGGRILDVGHGSGESLILLLSHPDVRRPSKLSGITSLPAHHQRSRDRIASMRLRNPDISEPKLYLGDAVYRLGREDHPLSPNNADMYDSILALDCAYHFHTRRDFLRQSLSHLAPGGRIALADICFPMSWKTMSLGTRALLTILKVIPMENIVSLDEYEADMRNMGYVDVKVEDISEEVFPGFIRFLKSRGWGWWIFGKVMSEFAGRARFVVVSGCAAA